MEFQKCLKPDCMRKVTPGAAYCCMPCQIAAADRTPWEVRLYDPEEKNRVLVHSEFCERSKSKRGEYGLPELRLLLPLTYDSDASRGAPVPAVLRVPARLSDDAVRPASPRAVRRVPQGRRYPLRLPRALLRDTRDSRRRPGVVHAGNSRVRRRVALRYLGRQGVHRDGAAADRQARRKNGTGMSKIRFSDITITVKYEVDCKVCACGVEPDEEFLTLTEARGARTRHLEEHARGEWD